MPCTSRATRYRDAGSLTTLLASDSTVKPSAAVASSAVASSALRDVVMAVAVVVPGTAMVAVIRTLAAVIVTSTADESTPATAVSGR
jgi:hypothetical protein